MVRRRAADVRVATITAAIAAAAATPLLPGRRRLVTLAQSLLPWTALPGLPVGLLAARRGDRLAAATAALTVTAVAGATLAQSFPRRQATAAPEGPALSVLHLNLLYVNARLDEVARLFDNLDADVVTFSELTPTHVHTLHRESRSCTWPFRIERPGRAADGTGIWSRYPLVEQPGPATHHNTVVADVGAPGGATRVIVTHTQSPLFLHDLWFEDMVALAGIDPAAGPPALMVGDLNSVWWHNEFRRLLAAGWSDAHILTGQGLHPSWPYDGRAVPFLRLDHALVDARLVVEGIVDFAAPGSDHRGFVVHVRRAVEPGRPLPQPGG